MFASEDIEIDMDLFLSKLNASLLVLLQEQSESRTCCKAKQSDEEEIVLKHLQSSAKSKGCDLEIDWGRSLMYIMNSNGHRTLPSGTPDVKGSKEEDSPSMEVSWYTYLLGSP